MTEQSRLLGCSARECRRCLLTWHMLESARGSASLDDVERCAKLPWGLVCKELQLEVCSVSSAAWRCTTFLVNGNSSANLELQPTRLSPGMGLRRHDSRCMLHRILSTRAIEVLLEIGFVRHVLAAFDHIIHSTSR